MLKAVGQNSRRQKESEEERLLNLFRNRAELKKAFSDLRAERNFLHDKLRNEEAATRRARERLEAIERLMAKPEAGYSGLVYFQLRALWRTSNEQLIGFAHELQRQQEDRERKKQVMRFNQDRDRELADLNDRIRALKDRADELRGLQLELEREIEARTGFWNFFKRRDLNKQLANRRAEHDEIRSRIEELFDQRIRIESEPWPEFPGLSVEGKRTINIAVIALAEHIYLFCSDGELARLAREAMAKPIQDVKYGTEEDCRYLMDRIQRSTRGLQAKRDFASDVKARARNIRENIKFRNANETVPMAESLDNVAQMASGDTHYVSVSNGNITVNVLSDEYWDLFDAFVR